MNAVEIEEAVSGLAAAPFDVAEFPFAFLAAFGNKETWARVTAVLPGDTVTETARANTTNSQYS